MKQQTAAQTWVLVLTAAATFMIALDALVVTTALTTIRMELHATVEQLEWTVNSYTLAFAVLLMIGAVLGDRFGRRRIFLAGISLFVLASAWCALAPSIGWLIAARTLQGCGAALAMPLAVTLLSIAFPPPLRAQALGLFNGIGALAVLSGPVVGGAIAGGLTWQWIFWLNVPIGLLVMPLILQHIPESTGLRVPIDLPGLGLFTGAAFGLVWGLVRGPQAGWTSVETLGSLIGGAVLLAMFLAWERRAVAPMLPLNLFRARVFVAGNSAGFLFFASLYGSTFFMAQFLQTVLGYGPFGTGIRLLPWTVMLFFSAPLAGILASRFGERAILVFGLLCQSLAMGWIALIAHVGMPYWELIAPLLLAGFGSAAIPTAVNAVISSVPVDQIGKASGTFNMLRQFGAAFGVAVLAAVFAAAGGVGSAAAFSNGFVAVMAGSSALSLLGALVAIRVSAQQPSLAVPVEAGV